MAAATASAMVCDIWMPRRPIVWLQDPQNRDKDQSAADHGEKRSFSALSDTLEHHISAQREGHAEEGEALDTQGSDTDADNSRVIPEHTHDGSGEYDTDQG